MVAKGGAVFYAIHAHPSDFPHHWVLRAYQLRGDGYGTPTGHYILVDTLAEARAAVPPGRRNIGRDRMDAGSLFEVWI